jgi:hypothetical protein
MIFRSLVNAARWTARTVGLLYFAFMSWFVGAHALSPDGLPPLWRASLHQQLDALALLLVVVGCVVGWKWDLSAAVMILSGNALWLLLNHQLLCPSGLTFLVGLLYGFCWWCTRRRFASQRQTTT